MDLRLLARYANRMENIMHGALDWEMRHGLDSLEENKDWELTSIMMLTAGEVPARRMAEMLLRNDQYIPLVLPGCFRRQVRKAEIIDRGGLRRKVFRDIDAVDMDDEAGIPDHIRETAEEIQESAERTRTGALARELAEDRDGVREFIVDSLGEKIAHSADAVNALILIACCSMWEDTRRIAALKVANHALTVRKMVAAGRANELLQISSASRMESVAINISNAMTDLLPTLKQENNVRVLKFIAKNHPDHAVRRDALEGVPPDQRDDA